MDIGVSLGYWGSGSARSDLGAPATGPDQTLALARRAEELGYAVAWVAEAYGSDAPTVLAWLAAQTSRIDLGSAVMQIPARSAAATAMTAATLDVLSGGRFRLGLGVSGPQVSEGWHGVRFDAPLARTREHVDVVRLALSRRPVVHAGEHLRLPLPDGPGVPLRLAVRPPRERIPVYLAAMGPRNVALAGEVADGWLPAFFSPEHAQEPLAALARGRTAAGGTGAFDVAPSVPLVVTRDGPAAARSAAAEAASGPLRAHAALYLGGMGSRQQNFYRQLAERMGYGAEAQRVQEHYLAGRHREAAAAVPQAFLEHTCLIGPAPQLSDRLAAFAAAGATTVSVIPLAAALEARLDDLRTAAEALDAAGLAA